MPNKVNLFLVGAQKSGSTALAIYLSQFNDISLSKPKATNYFNRKFNKSYQVTDYDEYISSFPEENAKYICDASDSYHADFDAIDDIYKYNPNAKVIMIVRDLRNMLYSLHDHQLWAGYQKIKDINNAYDCSDKSTGKYAEFLDYKWLISVGVHAKYLKDKFKDNLYIVRTEELRSMPELVMKNISDFLGVDNCSKFEVVVANENVVERSRLFTKVNRYFPTRMKVKIKRGLYRLGFEPDGVFRKINGTKNRKEKSKPVLSSDITKYIEQEEIKLSEVIKLNVKCKS